MPLNLGAPTFFPREALVAVASRVYEEALPPLTANSIVPPSGAEDLGARIYTREVYQHAGRSDFVGSQTDDLPKVNASIISDSYNIAMHGCCYKLSISDVRAAQFSGRPLSARLGIAARRAIEEKNDRVFFVGDFAKQIYGLAVYPITPRLILDLADFQPGANADDTLAAMYSVGNTAERLSNDAEQPTHLLLDSETYRYVSTTRASLLNNETILEVYQRNAKLARTVLKVRQFGTASPSGGRIIMAITVGADKLENIQPDPMTILAPQDFNLSTTVNHISETGGVASEYPGAHCIGILS
jgi:hypothetical protein